nr:RNA-binding glycine-rich protein [Tanacetum cinerariifolium]
MSSVLPVEMKVITDTESGRSSGYGFVNYDNDELANDAMKAMDGQNKKISQHAVMSLESPARLHPGNLVNFYLPT